MGPWNMLLPVLAAVTLVACGGSSDKSPSNEQSASDKLRELITAASGGTGVQAYVLPDSDDYANIPQDPSNPITAEKVALGQLLFHETALATEGVNPSTAGTWSCASCHHAQAGFKSGLPQGVAEGGEGFGLRGEARALISDFDADAVDETLKPDVQPIASPSILNTAFQEVMLWNGQFGNALNGLVNAGLDTAVLATPGTPKAENARQLAGLETQAVAGTAVHRMRMDQGSVVQTNPTYTALFAAAYPQGSQDPTEDAAKAIAAYERTILANQSPFQQWLRGDDAAMSTEEIAGASLFFGKAGCSGCHRGPALSSEVGATPEQMFFAIAFADFDPNHPQISGSVDDATSRGRGGFTGNSEDDYKFKVPTLYNLADADIYGHGASFSSIRDVVAYKNTAVAQKIIPAEQLDPRFMPLGLNDAEIDQLTLFLRDALYDANLSRYVPAQLPSASCFPVNDLLARLDLGCEPI